ncbi:hypothetical protein D9M71_824800 [compost metagenome]
MARRLISSPTTKAVVAMSLMNFFCSRGVTRLLAMGLWRCSSCAHCSMTFPSLSGKLWFHN